MGRVHENRQMGRLPKQDSVYRTASMGFGSVGNESAKYRDRRVIMPAFTVEFEVVCAKCGNGLCRQSYAEDKRGFVVNVEPCDKCLRQSYDDGFNDGNQED